MILRINHDVLKIINSKDDNELHELMTNLAGHDIEELSEVFLKNKKKNSKTYLFSLLYCKRIWPSTSRT